MHAYAHEKTEGYGSRIQHVSLNSQHIYQPGQQCDEAIQGRGMSDRLSTTTTFLARLLRSDQIEPGGGGGGPASTIKQTHRE